MQARHAGSKVVGITTHTLATTSCSIGASAKRKASDHAWGGYLLDSSPPLSGIITSLLRHSVLPLHAEEVARAREHLMKNSHDTGEHL